MRRTLFLLLAWESEVRPPQPEGFSKNLCQKAAPPFAQARGKLSAAALREGEMDNELDKRLQRLEAGQADQAEKLSRLLNGQERIHQTLMGLSAQMAEDENGLKLYEVLANLARAVDRNSAEMRMLVRRSSRQPDPSH